MYTFAGLFLTVNGYKKLKTLNCLLKICLIFKKILSLHPVYRGKWAENRIGKMFNTLVDYREDKLQILMPNG